MLLLTLSACSNPGDAEDFAALEKHPQVCSAQAHFAGLPGQEQLHFVFGALHSRPQASCIDDLIAAQDFSFIARLKEEMVTRGGYHDRDMFLQALAKQASVGTLSPPQVKALELNGLCMADSGIAPDQCLKRIERIEQVLAARK
ncbi:hypothetical protein [Pseudoxanthomonas indica]|uniref:Uncharacterized protein n=1 Tax=Pseudoxanthomonas indica TaxID=428993 RepID=A0A1T5J313_9GAMM|nr:hypothetical protein [Pseudoxanthomonas indica]GGD55992.1 hypothetical protein GCM10007235_30490 [Pseudoxanthomonas indica]SKC45721.1 hypothetical protein SAMN06296058_0473 [Pseudoxanthomonas indica]